MSTDLPLKITTPDEWAAVALSDTLALLNDHAHLEKKAATNALELLHRWPDPVPPDPWVRAMTAVARDEVEHLAIVTRLLSRRGGELTRNHSNRYAADLRDLIRMGQGKQELVDRLLVSGLIEARSCERFEILSRMCDDEELRSLYGELWTSEHGHYRIFVKLSYDVLPEAEVDTRWHSILEDEAAIIERQPVGSTMHGWV
ncbi:MAG: tRNA isopentenyl-2-thiomethyl-A-37 hydroxylase MiaE [Planctomycetota bacterium]|jgi:tRNA-(ms[2]io[6]A)-hydroxylase